VSCRKVIAEALGELSAGGDPAIACDVGDSVLYHSQLGFAKRRRVLEALARNRDKSPKWVYKHSAVTEDSSLRHWQKVSTSA